MAPVRTSLAVQALWLQRAFPEGTVRLQPSALVWRAHVRPLPSAGTYLLELRADGRTAPSIRVIDPDLVPDNHGRIPHVYEDGSICVAQAGDWRRSMLFVRTVVPWALEWLVFYEMWLATGIWMGDGDDRMDEASQAAILHPYSLSYADRESTQPRKDSA
ncbi:hypothetical protein ACFWFR_08395 [Oerskovia sp. NPDC060287]|uniref:hypothetical protein n=1 Tax=Oerskovia sp. NPDC060287 TaxID=3347095 RepID=UPI0036685D56